MSEEEKENIDQVSGTERGHITISSKYIKTINDNLMVSQGTIENKIYDSGLLKSQKDITAQLQNAFYRQQKADRALKNDWRTHTGKIDE